MYVLMDGEEIAGMAAVAICPDYRGKALGIKILEDAMEIAVKNGKKALRLDALKSNLPAQKMYEKAGLVYSGKQRLYAENTGMTEFLYYEKIPKEN